MAAELSLHELAAQIGVTRKECMDLCLDLGIEVKTLSSGLSPDDAERVREEARMRPLESKRRVHEVARELGLTNQQCLDLCLELGIAVMTHSSGLLPYHAERVREEARRRGLAASERRPPLDVGPVLLDPVTLDEYRGVEEILAVLWKSLDRCDLSRAQEDQILAMARFIESERATTNPGETKRWKVVGAVRGALRYLARDAAKDVLAWSQLIEILMKIRWEELAGLLSGVCAGGSGDQGEERGEQGGGVVGELVPQFGRVGQRWLVDVPEVPKLSPGAD